MSHVMSSPSWRRPLVASALAVGLALSLNACVVAPPRVHAAVVAEYPAGPMPAPIVETAGPPPAPTGWSWVPGHWVWGPHHWHWIRGHWVNEVVPPMPAELGETPPGPPPSPAHVWIRGHWRWGGHGWVWAGGSWALR